MRILLRNAGTRRYYAGARQWVANADLAIDFGDAATALDFAAATDEAAEIALAYDRRGLRSRFSREWISIKENRERSAFLRLTTEAQRHRDFRI